MMKWRAVPALLLALMTVAPALASAPPASAAPAEDTYSGSDLWLHYTPVTDPALLARYKAAATTIVVDNADRNPVYRHTANLSMEAGSNQSLVQTSLQAARAELVRGLGGLLGQAVPVQSGASDSIPDGAVVVGTRDTSDTVEQSIPAADLASVGPEGYVVRSVSGPTGTFTVIAGNTEVGALYGTFAFLRLMQTQKPITNLHLSASPKVKNRHLDNWEGTRLYAGNNAAGTGGLNGENGTIFNFAATGASAGRNLPVILDRYIVMARALASVGINGIEINLVNANNVYLTTAYIAQEAALADALRPYGIKISVAINYTAPTDARFAPDTLTNQQLDPHSAAFRGWWTRKAQQLQAAIPDFMGFTVKANSEGQPGPQDFGYDHGDGANGIATAVAPLGMKVFWRTFVYNADVDNDRLKRAYLEFGYIDDEPQPDGSTGRFASNVFLQTKNGPLDFQGREPIHPMFGRMENTDQALELEITQEYTGQNKMLTYLAPMWEEALKTDTYATDKQGVLLKNRLMGNVVDGSAQGHTDTAMVGVANLGNADNLTGNHFSQANLYAFGRQAWDWTQGSEAIADDWVRMTWSNDAHVVQTIVQMMMGSREALVSYQTPLGVAHQFNSTDHYGPGPSQWVTQDDFSPVYYNKADSAGLGFDRSPTGSNFVAQYFPTLEQRYGNIETTPENLLGWFHHVPWDHRMNDGRTFWDELVYRYQMGVEYVTWMRETWDSLQPFIDARRFSEVKAKLATHEADAANWRDTLVSYWQEFSQRDIPVDGGPLSAKIVIGGKSIGGFNLSSAAYTIPVAAGASPAITSVIPADPAASYEIVSQAAGVPGQAVVKVTKDDFFGPIVKNYVLNLVPDTTLATLKVNNMSWPSFKPDVLSYNALMAADMDAVARVDAIASDPAASVVVQQAPNVTGQATVTVTNGAASSVYTVNFDTAISGSDEFAAAGLGSQWHWVRPDDSKWRLAGGSLIITSQSGDLQATANTAKNLALQDVNGDWSADSKVVFSRPLANNNEQGGIIAYANDNNYVKLAWEMGSSTAPINKLRVVVIREQNGTATTLQVQGSDAQKIVGAGGAIWLRLTKVGSTYKAYYSSDGSVYRYMGTTTLNVEPAQAGLVAFNRAGTSTDLDVAFDYFRIQSKGDPVPRLHVDAGGTVGGAVPATLSLTLGAPATFGAFTPGVAKDYAASTTATVISTAGDATLTVSDPSTTAPGKLVNGAFSLPSPLTAAGSALPATVKTWSAPVSNDAVTVAFAQHIGAADALRTGAYGKTLTFTLSTTNP
jgi:alpha-glucuronidase